MAHGGSEDLTPREREVLELVARRWTDEDIAECLQLTTAEVNNLIARILAKVSARSREELWLREKSKELTPREREVLELLKQRKTNEEMAEHFVVSVRTIETHVSNVLHKLGYKDRQDLWRDEVG